MPHVFDLLLGFFSCVLTVGFSPTKSMSTKNPKLGKTDRQLQIRFKGQVYVYIYIFIYVHVLFCTVDL